MRTNKGKLSKRIYADMFTSFDYTSYFHDLQEDVRKLQKQVFIRNWIIFIETLILIWRFL